MPAHTALQTGYLLRHPTEADIPAIIAVIDAHDIAETGEADSYEVADILNDWADLTVETDALVAVTENGFLAGYCTVTYAEKTGRILADGYVHPEHYGQGIGSSFLNFMERRAHDITATIPEGARIVLVNNVIANSDAARNIMETRAYTLNRVFFRMHISLAEAPAVPALPEGITLRSCDGSPADIRRAYETIEETFADHWGHTQQSYEDWQRWLIRENLDTSLWFFLQDGDEIVGTALCRVRDDQKGWITQLGIRRQWRKNGLGQFLLKHAFATFYNRGVTRVGLGVDGQSLTGANRLYERVGMEVTMKIGRYEKELRPGIDLRPE